MEKVFLESDTDGQGEIRATGFNEQVDKFYDKLDEGKVSETRVYNLRSKGRLM